MRYLCAGSLHSPSPASHVGGPEMSAVKRRRRAVERRAFVEAVRRLWDYRTGRIPRGAVQVMLCSCGTRMWLLDGASSDERDRFDADAAAHDYCDVYAVYDEVPS